MEEFEHAIHSLAEAVLATRSEGIALGEQTLADLLIKAELVVAGWRLQAVAAALQGGHGMTGLPMVPGSAGLAAWDAECIPSGAPLPRRLRGAAA